MSLSLQQRARWAIHEARRRWLVMPVAIALAAALSATSAASRASSSAAAAVDQPNIILITTDDQSVHDLRFMPHTRRLIGAAGVTFTNAFAPNPLCCPARATILTGQLSHNNGVRNNAPPYGGYGRMRPLNGKALPVWMSRAGYATTLIGKYLNRYPGRNLTEVPAGWSNWNGAVDSRGTYDYYGVTLNRNGVLVGYPGRYQADVYQELAEQAIREATEHDTPFFLWQSNLAPHGGCSARPGGGCVWGPPKPAPQDADSFGSLPLHTMSHPAFNERVVSDKPPHIRRRPRWTRAQVSQAVRDNRARVRSLQAVDRNVRDTVDLLGQLGELDNTLIILTSDNGFVQGQHRLFGKMLPYEPSLRVPLLMRGPGIPAGTTRNQVTALVDIAPTIAAAGGAQPLLRQDGRSLLPLARGTSTRGYEALSIESGGPDESSSPLWFYQGLRTRRYTYVEYPRTGERELYDRQVDPHQLTNVAYRPTHTATRTALVDMLSRLRECAGLGCRDVTGPVPPPEPSPAPVHPDELGSIGDATQVITLTAPNWTTGTGTLVAWQRTGRTWRIVRGPFEAQIGGNGLAEAHLRRHGTGKTPAGTFSPASAVGVEPNPGTPLPYRRLDDDDYLPFDPESAPTYNVFQPYRSATATWRASHAERWWEHRHRFPHAVIMDHNQPLGVTHSTDPDEYVASQPANVEQGSLVLHVGDRLRTYGWVSTPPAQLRWLLSWMEPSTGRTTFVVGTPAYLRRNL